MKVGDIVRYSTGPTALLRILDIVHDRRVYGRHVLGGYVGAELGDCKPATENEKMLWKHYIKVYSR
jgi:hypothetical protein